MASAHGANPLVAERAPWRSSQSCVWQGGQQPMTGNPYRFLCHFFCTAGKPCATRIVIRGEGSFRYQGVSTRGVRHWPGGDFLTQNARSGVVGKCGSRFWGSWKSVRGRRIPNVWVFIVVVKAVLAGALRAQEKSAKRVKRVRRLRMAPMENEIDPKSFWFQNETSS